MWSRHTGASGRKCRACKRHNILNWRARREAVCSFADGSYWQIASLHGSRGPCNRRRFDLNQRPALKTAYNYPLSTVVAVIQKLYR